MCHEIFEGIMSFKQNHKGRVLNSPAPLPIYDLVNKGGQSSKGFLERLSLLIGKVKTFWFHPILKAVSILQQRLTHP